MLVTLRRNQMLTMAATACIDAPVEKVWSVLANLEGIHLWVRAIRHSYCPDQSRGVGALRVCELKQATVRETVVEWNEGRSFKYRGEGAPLMKAATNLWSVQARGTQTLVMSSVEVTFKGGILGRLLELLMKPLLRRFGRQSLASLKYFVERGRSYEGPLRSLPSAPASC
jgi:hypothetical protein